MTSDSYVYVYLMEHLWKKTREKPSKTVNSDTAAENKISAEVEEEEGKKDKSVMQLMPLGL